MLSVDKQTSVQTVLGKVTNAPYECHDRDNSSMAHTSLTDNCIHRYTRHRTLLYAFSVLELFASSSAHPTTRSSLFECPLGISARMAASRSRRTAYSCS